MSSRSVKARSRPAPPDAQSKPDQETQTIEVFEPDYGGQCHLCGESPTVIGLAGGRVIYESGMCGPCTFGNAEAFDPSTW